MSECILFYTKLHCDWSLARAGRGGGGWRGGLYGDVPLAGYGFLPLCPKLGIQFRVSLSAGYCCTTGFICWINFVQYKGNDYNVDLL